MHLKQCFSNNNNNYCTLDDIFIYLSIKYMYRKGRRPLYIDTFFILKQTNNYINRLIIKATTSTQIIEINCIYADEFQDGHESRSKVIFKKIILFVIVILYTSFGALVSIHIQDWDFIF